MSSRWWWWCCCWCCRHRKNRLHQSSLPIGGWKRSLANWMPRQRIEESILPVSVRGKIRSTARYRDTVTIIRFLATEKVDIFHVQFSLSLYFVRLKRRTVGAPPVQHVWIWNWIWSHGFVHFVWLIVDCTRLSVCPTTIACRLYIARERVYFNIFTT